MVENPGVHIRKSKKAMEILMARILTGDFESFIEVVDPIKINKTLLIPQLIFNL